LQIIMASRVLYGLSRQGELPSFFGAVNGATQTPINATAVTTARVLVFAVLLPLHHLADFTSRVTLVVFALFNLALVASRHVRCRRRPAPTSRPPGCHGRRWPRARVC
jgi:APA family basic amino acid/polyamine antiporter